MNLLIVGCGDLGGRVAKLALGRGDRVIGVRRDAGRVPSGVDPIAGDVADPASLRFPSGMDAMVYAVAASERTDEGYARAYPRGLGHALGALDRTSPGSPVVFISSTAVYGENDGQWVDEDTELQPARFQGERMAEAEAVLRSRGHGTSLRLGGIYGPGRTRLIDLVRAGTFDPAPPVRQWTNRIHVDDAARAAVHLLDRHLGGSCGAEVLNGVDEAPVLREEVLSFIADLLGVPGPAPGMDDAHEESRPFTNKRVRGDRLRESGFRYRYPTFREGYSALLGITGK